MGDTIMDDQHTASLRDELDRFRAEKEKIRKLVGQVGGTLSVKRERVITLAFVAALAILLVVDVFRHFLGLPLPFPPLVSLEVGVLLVSVKIIWMIHKQAKVEHFQFWILNSIEFRLDQISRQLQKMEKEQTDADPGASGGGAP